MAPSFPTRPSRRRLLRACGVGLGLPWPEGLAPGRPATALQVAFGHARGVKLHHFSGYSCQGGVAVVLKVFSDRQRFGLTLQVHQGAGLVVEQPGIAPPLLQRGLCQIQACLLYPSPSPRDYGESRLPSSA